MNRSDRRSLPCRVLLMIASMDGGGSEQQTLLMLRHLCRKKFAPELFLLKRGGALFSQIPPDIPVHCFEDEVLLSGWNFPGSIYRSQVAYLRRLLIKQCIDVVYDRTFHMTLIAGPAAKQAKVPRVSTIVSPPSYAVPLNAGRFQWIKKKRLASAYRDAAKTIAVSSPAAQDARKYYQLKPHQVLTVPNPVDSTELDSVVSSSTTPDRDDRYTIACVGRMTQEKGHCCLINAVQSLRTQFPEFQLPRIWLIGDGPLRSDLEQKTHRLGLSEAIHFLGHINQPAPWIKAADALCLPSVFEGFPNVMLEAMSLGTPVIASDIPVVRSLGRVAKILDDRGRDYVATFRSQDEEHLARKIRRLRLNPTATISRVVAAKNLARRTHAIDAILPRLEVIMLKAMK